LTTATKTRSAALREIQFSEPAGDAKPRRHPPQDVRREQGWLIVEGPALTPEDRSSGMLGHAGLWRPDSSHRLFEVPLWTIEGAADPDEGSEREAALVRECVAWALATASGAPPAAWEAPDVDRVRGWMPEGASTVLVGGDAYECVVERTADRLALRTPLALDVCETLSPARRAWLELYLSEARRWRMVRLGEDRRARCLWAEVDLSGAPDAALSLLIPAALDALRWVVSWAAKTASVIASGTLVEALEEAPHRAEPGKGVGHVG
jgi:hypothetical protein